jgi:uncharacterized membrane protein
MTLVRSSWTLAGCLLFTAGPLLSTAEADLRLCNRTSNLVGVAIGYKGQQDWMTEGWWNIPPSSCETLLAGSLSSRYYYVYAVDYEEGGEWTGPGFMCTRDEKFTIKGVNDCIARGFQRTGFFEVDTGEQLSWTVQLMEPSGQDAGGQ